MFGVGDFSPVTGYHQVELISSLNNDFTPPVPVDDCGFSGRSVISSEWIVDDDVHLLIEEDLKRCFAGREIKFEEDMDDEDDVHHTRNEESADLIHS